MESPTTRSTVVMNVSPSNVDTPAYVLPKLTAMYEKAGSTIAGEDCTAVAVMSAPPLIVAAT